MRDLLTCDAPSLCMEQPLLLYGNDPIISHVSPYRPGYQLYPSPLFRQETNYSSKLRYRPCFPPRVTTYHLVIMQLALAILHYFLFCLLFPLVSTAFMNLVRAHHLLLSDGCSIFLCLLDQTENMWDILSSNIIKHPLRCFLAVINGRLVQPLPFPTARMGTEWFYFIEARGNGMTMFPDFQMESRCRWQESFAIFAIFAPSLCLCGPNVLLQSIKIFNKRPSPVLLHIDVIFVVFYFICFGGDYVTDLNWCGDFSSL